MCLLHFRNDYVRSGTVADGSEPDRNKNQRSTRRKHLSLRHASSYRRRRAARGPLDEGRRAMNDHANISPAIEPGRYELREARAYVFDLTRRDLFKFLGAGALILCASSRAAALQESGRGQRRMDDMPKDIGAWLHIGEEGKVTVFTGKVEVGQNI